MTKTIKSFQEQLQDASAYSVIQIINMIKKLNKEILLIVSHNASCKGAPLKVIRIKNPPQTQNKTKYFLRHHMNCEIHYIL